MIKCNFGINNPGGNLLTINVAPGLLKISSSAYVEPCCPFVNKSISDYFCNVLILWCVTTVRNKFTYVF